jgi:catechol 2,3-dioxygenase-like lactoylglutathione lyase family enzyme
MKRFHISIAVSDFATSLADYSKRLGCKPIVAVEGRYALWKTDLLNFTISCREGQASGVVRHIGFEDEHEKTLREEKDVNGITWEYFSADAQMQEVKEKFNVTPDLIGGLEPHVVLGQESLDPRTRRG